MPANSPILEPASLQDGKQIVGKEGIREWVPQRHEFEMLDCILHYESREDARGTGRVLIAVARKEISPNDFWVRGHIPGRPLFPGVLMIESAAQLCCYCFCRANQEKRFFAFGGVDEVRFRGTVKPGDRLILMVKARRARSNLGVFDTQGYVDGKLVFEAIVTGMVLPDR